MRPEMSLVVLQFTGHKQWRMIMDNKKTEVRTLTKDFPKLVMPDGRPIASMEIDVDALSKEKKYQYGGWDDSLNVNDSRSVRLQPRAPANLFAFYPARDYVCA